jgi:putative addiction module component (TIGR02574 family)
VVEEVRKIVEQALKMPARERAEIAQRLLESLDRQMDINVESAWQSEVERRISELDSGQVACIPWEEVRERLMRNSREAG